MARRVAWTETAWRDLERIGDHIADDSPGYAAALVRRIRDHASERNVYVLALIHGARDLAALWDQETRAGPADS